MHNKHLEIRNIGNYDFIIKMLLTLILKITLSSKCYSGKNISLVLNP